MRRRASALHPPQHFVAGWTAAPASPEKSNETSAAPEMNHAGIGTFFGAAESRATGIDIHPGATIDPQSRRIRAKCTLQTLPKMFS
jgi:hypothetical protein